MTELPQILRSLSLFEHASDEAIDELIHLSSTRLRSYEAGDIVARQGAEVHALLILITGIVYSSEHRLPVAIEVTEPATILHLDKEQFLGFMSRHPSVMRAYLEMISDRCNFLSNKINTLNLQSLRERLISYVRSHGIIGKQVDLALLLGVTRPALARVIGELVEEGILIKRDGEYQLSK